MARLNNFLMLLSFLSVATIPFISAIEEGSLKECAKHIGSHCGNQVKDKLFHHNRTRISTDCCYKLYQSGYSCLTKLTVHLLQTTPELKNADWVKVLAKNDQIFNQCDKVTEPESPKFLLNCAINMGPDCGDEVVNNIFHGQNITKQCCAKLVKTGQRCHINMVKALIRTPEMRNVNAEQALMRSMKTFEHCQHD